MTESIRFITAIEYPIIIGLSEDGLGSWRTYPDESFYERL